MRDTVLPGGVNREDRDPFDGVETGISSLAAFAGATPPAALSGTLDRIRAAVGEARKAFDANGPAATVPPLVRGLSAVRELRTNLASMPIAADARFEIDHRLKVKEAQFGEALKLAAGVQLEAIVRDGIVVPGQGVQVDLMIANRSGSIPVMISRRSVAGFETPAELCKDDVLLRGPETRSACTIAARIPADAKYTAAHFKYAPDAARFIVDPDVPPGLPFRPTPFIATFVLNIAGADVSTTIPVQLRSEGDLFSGEKREEIQVVPRFAATVAPSIAVVPRGATPATSRGTEREVRVTVTHHGQAAAKAEVQLELPRGWSATPASAPVVFTREDEAMTVRFRLLVPPAPMLKASDVALKARVTDGATTYADGYQVVEYPHTTRRHVMRAPEVAVKLLDVKVAPNLTVGYVMGVGDEIPEAMRQLGPVWSSSAPTNWRGATSIAST